MALSTATNLIKPNSSLYAPTEQGRLNHIAANRRLYNADYSALGVASVDASQGPVITNWYRRIPEFYARFVLSERPIITTGNERLDMLLKELEPQLWPEVEHANIRSIAYGEGILASNPYNPELLFSFEPDAHFRVEQPDGTITMDICIEYRLELDGSGFADVYHYPTTSGYIERITYAYNAGLFMNVTDTMTMPFLRSGRQVIELRENPDLRSPLEDIKPSLKELVNIQTGLARTIKRHSNPHLAAPVAVVDTISDNSTDLSQPQLMGMNEGDEYPKFIAWESNIDSFQYAIRKHEDAIWNMTGLSRVLFDLDTRVGITSGVALRRLLLPFVSELNHRANMNTEAIKQYLAILHNNRLANNMEPLDYSQSDVTIDYQFDDIFKDDPEGGMQPNNQTTLFNND